MLARWTKILPFFIVKWIAYKYCERIKIGSEFYILTYNNTLILDKNKTQEIKFKLD